MLINVIILGRKISFTDILEIVSFKFGSETADFF